MDHLPASVFRQLKMAPTMASVARMLYAVGSLLVPMTLTAPGGTVRGLSALSRRAVVRLRMLGLVFVFRGRVGILQRCYRSLLWGGYLVMILLLLYRDNRILRGYRILRS